ncbi:MAG: nicotinate-nicotinamide nucleotide adenylyltransferase [Bdellovibrionales bacterium]|nr:nicotinate-nicotinamide nucleotide adenylyltransferase [Bdellovibrionales bacterium]
MNAVLGGTFDPVHEGHLHLIQTLRERLGFKKFFVVPAGQNPLKSQSPFAAAQDRLEMVKLALRPLGWEVVVLDWEVCAPPPSFTVSTLERMHREGMAPLTLVMGDDVYSGFESWRSPDRIRELARILVVTRNNSPDPLQRVETFSFNALPYSATALRKSLHNVWNSGDLTQRPKGLPEPVWAFIKKKKLYAESPT